ncbi:MAG TPA: ROK family protein [Spirochaetia bacterium]|nr:ROK family protein [Spirochaetia bacterium]
MPELVYLGIDVGGSKLAVGVVDAAGRVVEKITVATDLAGGTDRVVDQIAAVSRPFLASYSVADHAGMTLPGPVSPQEGVLLFAPYSGWRNVPFARLVRQAIGIEISIENDVNACAWAEYHFGATSGAETLFWMTVSTGIGGAVISNGKLLRGARQMSGEIGHLVVEENGAVCGCGNRGCLEAEAAGPAWSRKMAALMAEGHGTSLPSTSAQTSGPLEARQIAEAARRGDPLSLAVVDDVATHLARGIAAAINLLDPQLFVIGGGVGMSLDLLLPAIRRELPRRCIGKNFLDTVVVPTALGYDAALIGAASLVIHPM